MLSQWLTCPRVVIAAASWAFFLGAAPQALSLPSDSVSQWSSSAQRQVQIQRIMEAFEHPQAQAQMRTLGWSPKDLEARLFKLDDSQLEAVAHKADAMRTTGVLGVIIALLVIAILVVILIWLLDKEVDVDVKDKD